MRCDLAGLVLLIVLSSTAAHAGGIATWTPVDDARLERARGGFDVGNGIIASFGIDRAVYINGNLMSSTRVYIPDIARMDGAQASALAAVIGGVNLVQNGPGNRVDPSLLQPGVGATIVQNTLDNQRIQALTTLTAGTNSLDLYRDLGLQDSLQSALLRSQGH